MGQSLTGLTEVGDGQQVEAALLLKRKEKGVKNMLDAAVLRVKSAKTFSSFALISHVAPVG